MIFMTGSTSYEPLYAGLEVSDQAAIVDYLKENNIPYRLDPSASAIQASRFSTTRQWE